MLDFAGVSHGQDLLLTVVVQRELRLLGLHGGFVGVVKFGGNSSMYILWHGVQNPGEVYVDSVWERAMGHPIRLQLSNGGRAGWLMRSGLHRPVRDATAALIHSHTILPR